MKRRRILLLLALAAVAIAAGFVAFWPRGPKEPVYQGKRLSEWIDGAAMRTSGESFQTATNAVRAVGAHALPWLLSEFTRRDSRLQASFVSWAEEHPRLGFRPRGETMRIQMAAYGLYLLGPELTPALPTLATYLGDSKRGQMAGAAMSGAGMAAFPYLTNSIASEDISVAGDASFAIGLLARETEAVIPTLIQWLQRTNSRLRMTAAQALGNASSRTNEVVSVLTGFLLDPDPLFQVEITHALLRKRNDAKPAIPSLRVLMTNSDPYLARIASNAVLIIDPTALPASAWRTGTGQPR